MIIRNLGALAITVVLVLGQEAGSAEPAFTKDHWIHFTTVTEAKALLANQDIYIQGLSPFERAAKIKQAGPV